MQRNVAHPFLTQQNKDLLWEIIQDNEIIRQKNPIQREQIGLFFQNMTREFYEREKDNVGGKLINMNKAFITTFFTVLNTHFNSGHRPVTHQQLQEERLTDFQNHLERRERDFASVMKPPTPDPPRFEDRHKDTPAPLDELDLRVKQMAAAREMDFTAFNQSNKEQAEQWLRSRDTSVKIKAGAAPPPPNEKVYIQITEEPIENNVIQSSLVDLENRAGGRKHLTWDHALHDDSGFPDPTQFLPMGSAELSNPFTTASASASAPAPDWDEKIKGLEDQLTGLSKTFETYMEKSNNTLSVIYALLLKLQQNP